jgi:hypothetical protein
MVAQSSNGESDVMEEILSYLRNHPNAADTLDGILNWWLPRQRYETEQKRIEQGLEHLVTQGLVSKKVLSDGTILYLRNEEGRKARN